MRHPDLDLSPGTQIVLEHIQSLYNATARVPTPLAGPYLLNSKYMLATLGTLAVAGTQCTLAAPPTSIHTTFDASGNLRHECLHPPPGKHCWTLSGIKTSC